MYCCFDGNINLKKKKETLYSFSILKYLSTYSKKLAGNLSSQLLMFCALSLFDRELQGNNINSIGAKVFHEIPELQHL